MKITKDKIMEWLALSVGFTVIYFVICIGGEPARHQ